MARRRTGRCWFRKSCIISTFFWWTLAGLIHFRYIDITLLFTYPWTIHLRIAGIWIGKKLLQGVAVFALLMAFAALFSAIHDSHRRLVTSPDQIPTPAALESGITEDSTPSSEPGAACKLFFFIIVTLLFAAYIHTLEPDLVSPSKPFLENVGACLMFGVRGLEILFILALVIRLAIWVKDICIPHVGEGITLESNLPDAGGEVTFDEGAGVEDESKEKVEDESEEKVVSEQERIEAMASYSEMEYKETEKT
ncbi:hypothetical protein C8R45DRAFT_1029723 [Mycena sanguinolenta]|nr:hypothetical protein C8R45DRAFT_1029723 [Mycena sanguinolenta]